MASTIRYIIIAAMMFFFGCSTSPLGRYADFPEKKKQIASTFILSDFVLMEAASGDTIKVDVPESKKYSKTCVDYFSGKLNERNYHVERSLVSSVGLLMDQKRKNRVIKTNEDAQAEPSTLPFELPPYYIHEVFSRDTILAQLLKIVYSSLMGYEKGVGEISKKIPAAKYLGKAFNCDMIAVVFAIGYDTPVSYRLGVNRISTDIRFDKMPVEPITQFRLMFYIVDTEKGEVVWDDKVILKGGTINKEKLESMINKIVTELP